MHASAFALMRCETEKLTRRNQNFVVLDFGSQAVNDQAKTHRELFTGCKYTGVDITTGANVDLVMPKPYTIPLPRHSVDLVVSGQVFEHIPFPWVSILEITRILKTGGHLVIIAPSRGHRHSKIDCWRYYPDAFKALAAFSGLKLVKAKTDWPPKNERRHFDYAGITAAHYWGDSVGIFKKVRRSFTHRIGAAILRELLKLWANSRDLGGSHNASRPPETQNAL